MQYSLVVFQSDLNIQEVATAIVRKNKWRWVLV